MKPSDCSQKGVFLGGFLQVDRTAELKQVHQDQARLDIERGETHAGSEDIEVTLTGSPNLLLQPCLFTCAHDTACAPLRGNQSSTRFTATEWNTVILYQKHSLGGGGLDHKPVKTRARQESENNNKRVIKEHNGR